MKTAILLALTALISTSAFAAGSEIVSFGRNNVEFATLWGENISLRLKEDSDNETTYQISCEKKVLTLVMNKEEGVTVGQTKVENCTETLRSVYETALESTKSVVFRMSETANSQGIYKLYMNYSFDL